MKKITTCKLQMVVSQLIVKNVSVQSSISSTWLDPKELRKLELLASKWQKGSVLIRDFMRLVMSLQL